jgi:hypothetical protein
MTDHLVGGAITILKHMKVSWDDDIPIYEMENKINLKPPTRHVLLWDVAQSDHILILEPHLKF